jgi:predicted dehydrogenase
MNRREFLQRSALSGAAMLLVEETVSAKTRQLSPNEKLNVACIGVAGMGSYSVSNIAGENVVALCDVDENNLNAAAKDFPKAALYFDYRKMLERSDIDAVTVSTPDHSHAPATMWALESGRHVYCEKPLTHTVAEARMVADLARKKKLATQMGIQIHANNNYRRVVEIVQAGSIGPVAEVHQWVDRVWSGPGKRPDETPPVPETLHWNLWLGPAAERPYSPEYLPAKWRGWWDFGGGALGDMACHHMDLPFWALNLRYCDSVAASGPPPNAECAPDWTAATYTFPVRGKDPAVTLFWYNGAQRPKWYADNSAPEWANTVFVGEKGMLAANYDQWAMLPADKWTAFVPPKQSIAPSPGHHAEWLAAAKSGKIPSCNFDYAGPLSEAVLLANVSYRSGSIVEFDAKKLKIKNNPEAEKYLSAVWRPGWKP